MNERMFSVHELGLLLEYNDEQGALIWKKRPNTMPYNRIFNSRFTGKIAGVPNNTGHVLVSVRGTRILAHRIIWALHTGDWPKGQIDHINGNPSDNRISNLRDIPHTFNQRNMKKNCRNTSGYCGVRMAKTQGKWFSTIQIENRTKYLGTFETKEAAFAARKAAEAKIGGYTERHGT